MPVDPNTVLCAVLRAERLGASDLYTTPVYSSYVCDADELQYDLCCIPDADVQAEWATGFVSVSEGKLWTTMPVPSPQDIQAVKIKPESAGLSDER